MSVSFPAVPETFSSEAVKYSTLKAAWIEYEATTQLLKSEKLAAFEVRNLIEKYGHERSYTWGENAQLELERLEARVEYLDWEQDCEFALITQVAQTGW